MSRTLVDRLLDLAEQTIEDNPQSSAIRRRAVSTAYYAAFHALMRTCADVVLPDADANSPEYAAVYRAIDHGSLKRAFGERPGSGRAGPLRETAALREIGDLIVPLQSARVEADYSPPKTGFYKDRQVEEYIAIARRIVERLRALRTQDRVVLAVHLIFKDRSR